MDSPTTLAQTRPCDLLKGVEIGSLLENSSESLYDPHHSEHRRTDTWSTPPTWRFRPSDSTPVCGCGNAVDRCGRTRAMQNLLPERPLVEEHRRYWDAKHQRLSAERGCPAARVPSRVNGRRPSGSGRREPGIRAITRGSGSSLILPCEEKVSEVPIGSMERPTDRHHEVRKI